MNLLSTNMFYIKCSFLNNNNNKNYIYKGLEYLFLLIIYKFVGGDIYSGILLISIISLYKNYINTKEQKRSEELETQKKDIENQQKIDNYYTNIDKMTQIILKINSNPIIQSISKINFNTIIQSISKVDFNSINSINNNIYSINQELKQTNKNKNKKEKEQYYKQILNKLEEINKSLNNFTPNKMSC